MATTKSRRSTPRPAVQTENEQDPIEAARQALAAERERRVEAFLADLNELFIKHNVRMEAKPVELQVIALDLEQ